MQRTARDVEQDRGHQLGEQRVRQDLLSAGELVVDVASFTDEQRKARETFIEQELHLPREWVHEDGWGVDASPAGRVATGIYNTLVESGAADPRFPKWDSWHKPASCSVRRSALCSRGETENRIRWTATRPTPASLCERYVTAL